METNLTVDRSDMADTAQPDKLAELLISQIAPQVEQLLPLPIEAVAKACGIREIQPLETDAFEGGLIQDEYKESGFILVKAGSRVDRRRFTIAHELGHFVNLRHVAPPGEQRLLCGKEHLRASETGLSGRFGMEAQANEFAASLLMPKSHIASLPLMRGSPEIARILSLQQLCNVSKEAAARRYAELHGDDFAIVFSREGKLLYSVRGGDFPWLEPRRGQDLFRDSLARTFVGDDGDVSDQEESDPHWWLGDRDVHSWELWEEVLVQQNGYRITLLMGERADEDD